MKILHIISSSGMYGAEAVILNLLRTLADGPHSATLGVFCNASNPNLELHEAALREGFDSRLIPCGGQVDRATIAAIRALAEKTSVDVIHAHGYKPDIYLYLGMRGRRAALVSTCHTWYDTDRIVTLYGKIDRLVLRGFDRVVAVSEEVRQRLLNAGVREEKIRMVRNGIDLRPFARPLPSPTQPSRELVIGLVGRLAWEKGVDLFLRAAAGVLPEFPGTRFVVYGEGADRAKLETLIGQLGIGERASLAGRREDMPAAYASFDVMVSASRQEGLPMAILEGMATGLPLVGSAVGEVPSLVRNGQTGILVPPEDLDALTAAILTLLRDAAERARLAAGARQLIQDKFSAARMTSDYIHVYEEAIVAKRAGTK